MIELNQDMSETGQITIGTPMPAGDRENDNFLVPIFLRILNCLDK